MGCILKWALRLWWRRAAAVCRQWAAMDLVTDDGSGHKAEEATKSPPELLRTGRRRRRVSHDAWWITRDGQRWIWSPVMVLVAGHNSGEGGRGRCAVTSQSG
ncbi:hypothetical protein U1Q18_037620 [Sarracenia purpurea var. burkii]